MDFLLRCLAECAAAFIGTAAFALLFSIPKKYYFFGGGIGAAMLEALACRQGRRICLEVELPETEIARRRIGFYRRCGFTLNDYPYIMPSLEAGRQPLPLMIMTSGGAVDEAAFLQIRDALYTTVYHTAVPG